MIILPVVSCTRATFRSAEFGFFGLRVYTRKHTPLFCGHPSNAGDFDFRLGRFLGLRKS